MQSIFARIIAFAAVLPLVSGAMRFVEHARGEYMVDGMAVSARAFQTLGEVVIAPVTLFAFAAIVEMLHRIAQRLPALSAAGAPAQRFWPWRSRVALTLLAAVAVTYVFIALAMYVQFTADGSFFESFPADQRVMGALSLIFYWVTEPLWLLAVAAGVEYLSRIAAASQPISSEQEGLTPPQG